MPDAKPDPQQAGARPGAEAKGGIDPHPGDPTSPAEAAARSAALRAKLAGDGFGDHASAPEDQ